MSKLEQVLKNAPTDALSDPRWRMDNLYQIQNKEGQVIPFRMNWAQRELFDRRWFRNLILKARQLGCTTHVQLQMLDYCLFVPNTTAGIVAHELKQAQRFFRKKIKFAYDRLDPMIQEMVPCEQNNTDTMEFANGSSLEVGVSLRSGTYQLLHISEYGKICARQPGAAEELRTGTLNTITPTGTVWIESTAEGAYGDFYDKSNEAEQMDHLVKAGAFELTSMHYRFFFFPWWREPGYILPGDFPIDDELEQYFQRLEDEQKIFLTPKQKNYYAMRAAEQGEKVTQEYPAFPAEAFYKQTKGAIFGKEIARAKRAKRVAPLPVLPDKPVNVFWDIGVNDSTAMWFQQRDGAWDNFIYYYAGSQNDVSHYIEVLERVKKRLKIRYGTLYLPHDAKQRSFSGVAGTTAQILMGEGYSTYVLRKPGQKMESIMKTRAAFPRCRFHEVNCKAGIEALGGYMFEYDVKAEAFRQRPKHNWASHGADAFQSYGMMAEFLDTVKGEIAQTLSQAQGTYSRKAKLAKRANGQGYYV